MKLLLLLIISLRVAHCQSRGFRAKETGGVTLEKSCMVSFIPGILDMVLHQQLNEKTFLCATPTDMDRVLVIVMMAP